MLLYNHKLVKLFLIHIDLNAKILELVHFIYILKIISLLGKLILLIKMLLYILNTLLVILKQVIQIIGLQMLILFHLLVLGIEYLQLLDISQQININHLIFIKLISLLRLSARELVELINSVCSMDIYYHLLNIVQLNLITWFILYQDNLDILKIEIMINVQCKKKMMIIILLHVQLQEVTLKFQLNSLQLPIIIIINQ